mgnify:CR=1 FL=1
MSRSPLAAGLALALAILAVSWGAILVRWCEAPSLVIAFYRLALATVLLVPFALATGGRGSILPAGPSLALVAASGLLLSVHFGAWITSLSYTTVASSVILVSTNPIFVGLASLWLLPRHAVAWGGWSPGVWVTPAPQTVVVAPTAPVFIERAAAETEAPAQQVWWYWCTGAGAYYPYVKECPGGWQRVAPQTAVPADRPQ